MVNARTLKELSSLHDIHMPDAIGWWPLAPGWYLLGVSVVITFLSIGLLSYRYYANGKAKRDALRALAEYQKHYHEHKNSQWCTSQISELLKRVALVYYSRTRVASLQGEEWLVFLNTTAKKIDFSPVRRQLLELPWRPSENQQLDELFKTARIWIMRQSKPCSK